MFHDTCFEDHKGEQLNSKFLHDFEKINKCLGDIENKNTRKNRLTAILVALDSEDKPDKKLIDKYLLLYLYNKYILLPPSSQQFVIIYPLPPMYYLQLINFSSITVI